MAHNNPHDKISSAKQLQASQLLDACPTLGTSAQLCVAFSGGLDSSVLLHLLVQLRDSGQLAGSLRAVHVNHGLQREAAQWAQHCRDICESWRVPCTVVDVKVALCRGESPEAAARAARYAAFAQQLQAQELLVQAHHQDDQAETVLLRLLRGSGMRGLGGIPAMRELGPATVLRPLLQVSRSALQHYAQMQQLRWIDDPSNADSSFDRNYLRHEVMPALRERWPEAGASLARSALLEQEGAALLDELAHADWQQAGFHLPNRLRLSALQNMTQARARNLLAYWLRHQPEILQIGNAPIHALLKRCIDELVLPRDDEHRVLQWGEGEQMRCLHRYRDALYLLKPLPAQPSIIEWNAAEELHLPFPLGSLLRQQGNEPCGDEKLIVKFRRGGEVIAMSSGQHKRLKNFLQENGVPPWLRDLVPLVYRGETLLAVGDIMLCSAPPRNEFNKHYPLCWKRSELLCGY